MKIKPSTGICPLCGGQMKAGKTTFTVDIGSGVIVVREVPATVCSQCGADWIEDDIAERLEKIVEDAHKKHSLVEVTTLGK